jgi:hypothetical protein
MKTIIDQITSTNKEIMVSKTKLINSIYIKVLNNNVSHLVAFKTYNGVYIPILIDIDRVRALITSQLKKP